MPALRGRAAKPDAWPAAPKPLSDANRADKAWITEQYDQLVGSRTVRRPGLDAGVLRLRPSLRGLAVALQGPRPGRADPFAAGVQAVLGAARNVACAGGEPIGLTDCLNFGNPEKPEIAYELAQAIEGIAQAAEALGIPVVSGNVSLYNDTDGRSIPPTPVVGCVGLVADVRLVPGGWQPGDVVLLAKAPEDEPRRRGRADPVPLEGCAAALALPRRRLRRPRARARRGGDAGAAARRTSSCLPSLRTVPRILAARPADVARLGSSGFVRDRAGALGCAASSASTRPTATSRGSRTSGSSRCSTAARSRPASPSRSRAASRRCATSAS